MKSVKENKCDLDDQLAKVDNLMAKTLFSVKETVENDIVFSKELFQKSFSALKKKNSHK